MSPSRLAESLRLRALGMDARRLIFWSLGGVVRGRADGVGWRDYLWGTMLIGSVFIGPEDLVAAGIFRSVAWAARAIRAKRAIENSLKVTDKALDAAKQASKEVEVPSLPRRTVG